MEVSEHYGFKKAIHMEELFALMPSLSPLVTYEYPKDRQSEKKAALLDRFQMSEDELIKQLKFEAVMIMSDVFCMELNLQILIDLCMSVDGTLGGPHRGV